MEKVISTPANMKTVVKKDTEIMMTMMIMIAMITEVARKRRIANTFLPGTLENRES